MTHTGAPGGTLAVIILTYNEEANIAQALSNVVGWADDVFVLDSMSTDGTLAIAKQYECHVAKHPFEDYGKQRNYALSTLPIRSEWVFFLDADELLSDALKDEIGDIIATSPTENGFYVNRRFLWMGRWIRRGYYPCWILRLLRHGKGRCEDRAINEHLIVEGTTGHLSSDLIHEDRRGVGEWITKHNRVRHARGPGARASRSRSPASRALDARLFGAQPERKRWIRQRVWNRLPPLVRPFVYFTYRYVLRSGFSTAGLDSSITCSRRSGSPCSSMSSISRSGATRLFNDKVIRKQRPRWSLNGYGSNDVRGYEAPMTDRLGQAHDFWNAGSCGEDQYLTTGDQAGYKAHSRRRYELEPDITSFANAFAARGRDVLEIGVGLGADHQFRRGRRANDRYRLTERAIEHVQRRFELFRLASDLRVANAECLPFPDNAFDLVYSWGVLHHTPDTARRA